MILIGEFRLVAHLFKYFKTSLQNIDVVDKIIWGIFSVHPHYKHDVGYRLSRSGLAIAYGQQVEFQGPIVQNVAYTSGGSTINITYTAVSSIELRNPNGFEVKTFLFVRI
jgi:hypothetical protein